MRRRKLTKRPYAQIVALFFLISIYLLLLYLVLTYKFKLDFTSFYSASLALEHGQNPYLALVAEYLPVPRLLSNNLCPPIFLWLLNPLFRCEYHTAVLLWFILSLVAGLAGAAISFNYAFSRKFIRENYLSLLLAYLALFSTLMNLAIGQIGALFFFFMMLGYHMYLKNRSILAGFLWGMMIAVKFFPALLFVYVLKQRRYTVFCAMLGTVLCCALIPLYVYGVEVYYQYYDVMTHISWYADSWNASIYGFLFRSATSAYEISADAHRYITIVYWVIFLAAFIIYCYLINEVKEEKQTISHNHYSFCLTLVFMLLLSPLGWMYYFSILILPLCLCWTAATQDNRASGQTLIFGLIIFFLLNFPVDYVRIEDMPTLFARMTFYSIHFYGLLLLSYWVSRQKKMTPYQGVNSLPYVSTVAIILIFGALVPTASFIMDFFASTSITLF